MTVLFGCAVLFACAQPIASNEAKKEARAMRQAPTEQDERVALEAANAAARTADAAAVPMTASRQAAAEPDEANRKLPPGPALTSGLLVERVVRLVESLRTPADTEPDAVAKAMALPLASDAGNRVGASGSLTGSGTYAVAVWRLYGQEALGQHVDVMLFPATWKGDPREPKNKISECTTTFQPLHDRLIALGLSGKRGPLYRPEQWTFLKKVGQTEFYVQVDVYRTDDGSVDGLGCVMQVSVDAANVGDVHG